MAFGVTWQEISAVLLVQIVQLVVLIVAIFLFVGLFNSRSLIRREFMAYFTSPIAYVVLVVFLIVTGLLFWNTTGLLTEESEKGIEHPMRSMYGTLWFWAPYLLIPALLTMRLFAEERGTGTLEVLMTAPLRDWQVVLSKYLACFAFYIFMWLPTLVYLPILLHVEPPQFHLVVTLWSVLLVAGIGCIALALLVVLLPLGTASRIIALLLLLGGGVAAVVGGWQHYHKDVERILVMPARIDPMPVLHCYLGLALVGAMFLAIGMLISSLVRSQMIAALISLAVSMLFVVTGFLEPIIGVEIDPHPLVTFFNIPRHFAYDFSRGVDDSRPLVLYASVALCCVFLTVRSLESRRWWS